MSLAEIRTPDDPAMEPLLHELSARAAELDRSEAWPAEQLRLCGEAGVYRWFLPLEWGGYGWSDAQAIRGYLRLSAACLTTTFILTQRTGACQRIVTSASEAA